MSKIINISQDEMDVIISIIGYLCYGHRITNFEQTLGASGENVEILLKKFLKTRDCNQNYFETLIEIDTLDGLSLNMELTEAEINIIAKAFDEAILDVDDWEFDTLMIVKKPQARQIQAKFIIKATEGED